MNKEGNMIAKAIAHLDIIGHILPMSGVSGVSVLF